MSSRCLVRILVLALGTLILACRAGDRGSSEDLVSLDALLAEQGEFNGQYVCTEGVYLTGFEVSALAASTEEEGGYLRLSGPAIWLEGATVQSRQDCVQTDTQPSYEFCQAVVCGMFEAGGSYGHGGGYSYQLEGESR